MRQLLRATRPLPYCPHRTEFSLVALTAAVPLAFLVTEDAWKRLTLIAVESALSWIDLGLPGAASALPILIGMAIGIEAARAMIGYRLLRQMMNRRVIAWSSNHHSKTDRACVVQTNKRSCNA